MKPIWQVVIILVIVIVISTIWNAALPKPERFNGFGGMQPSNPDGTANLIGQASNWFDRNIASNYNLQQQLANLRNLGGQISRQQPTQQQPMMTPTQQPMYGTRSRYGQWQDMQPQQMPRTTTPTPTPAPTTPTPTPTVPRQTSSTPMQPGVPVPASGINEDNSAMWVSEHNRVRQDIGKGLGNVTWNPTIASGAAAYAAQCNFSHSTNDARQFGNAILGENLAQGSSGYGAKQLFGLWEDEKKQYRYPNPNGSDGAGHFTQIVNRKTTEIGCGCAKCGGGQNMCVCRYNPIQLSSEAPY